MTAIKTENLSVSYGGIEAINDISIEIEKGDFACIIGQNGGGKTTLLKTVLNLLKQNSGNIILNSGNNISYVPQSLSIDKNFPINCLETVLSAFLKKGLNPFKRFSIAEKEKAFEYLKLVELEKFADRQISELSGGEFQRLLIARALASSPDIIFLDEPTANVDIISRNKIFETLGTLHKQGVTIVLVTHDLQAVSQFATRVICINHTLTYMGAALKSEELNMLLYSQSGGNPDVQ